MSLLPDTPLPRAGVASLGSGSKGNGTLVRIGGELLLVDCGFNAKQALKRMNRLGVGPGDISAILVTHEHSDHAGGVSALALTYNIPVHASFGTCRGLDPHLPARPFDSHTSFSIGAVEVVPVAVPHDCREPTQFVFRGEDARIGVISDLGFVTPHVKNEFDGCDVLMMEANHDRGMLARGRYPDRLKRRVGGNYGHLSNEQAADFLAAVHHEHQHVVIGHVSEENNHPDLLEAAFEPFRTRVSSLRYATQSVGVEWVGRTGPVEPLSEFLLT